jgi:hypothetical protein
MSLHSLKYKLPSSVLFSEIDAKGVFTDLNADRMYGVNQTACHLVQALLAGQSLGEAVEAVAKLYPDCPTVSEEMKTFAELLCQSKLILPCT